MVSVRGNSTRHGWTSMTLILLLVGAVAGCQKPADQQNIDWKLEVGLGPPLAGESNVELWLVLTNVASVARAICIEAVREGTVDRATVYPVPVGSCDDAAAFEVVPASSARVFRRPVPDREWERSVWRKHIGVYFVERSSTDRVREDKQAEWVGNSEDARQLATRLAGR